MKLFSCIPCLKRQNKKNTVILSVENTSNLNTLPNKFDKPFTKQYLLTENLSSSEINLLNQLRETKYTFKRPIGIELKKYVNNKPVIRFASWNLHNLTSEKIKNPGVLTVICLTILENNLSIIALQEVMSQEAVALICNELNNPTLTKIKLHNNSRSWGHVVSDEALGKNYQGNEFGALIYDKSKKIEILQSSQLNCDSNLKSFVRNPFFVNIKVEKIFFLFVIVHIKAVKSSDKTNRNSRTIEELNDISKLALAIKETLKPGHKAILLGDFNLNPLNECFTELRNQNYIYCIDSNLPTNTSKNNGKSYDNIWLNKPCEEYYTGNSGVISEGLYHSMIPKNGMNGGWGGCVSDHCPVWVDFFVHL